MNIFKVMDRGSDWFTERTLRQDRALVQQGVEAGRPIFIRVALRMLVTTAAILGAQLLPSPVDAFAWMVLGYAAGVAALMPIVRANAYRSGWLQGRVDLITSMQNTGNSQHALEYDMVHVLGIARPNVPDSPEGLE